MDREDFEAAINELYFYFKYKTFPEVEAMDIWFKKVKPIPTEAISYIIDQIENDAMPKNIPMAFWAKFTDWKKTRPSAETYNPMDDNRYPVHFMHQGVNILERSGEGEFLKFCNATGMPEADRERCRCKLNYCLGQDPKELSVTVGHHVNPGERKDGLENQTTEGPEI